jgi:hypothetical protein
VIQFQISGALLSCCQDHFAGFEVFDFRFMFTLFAHVVPRGKRALFAHKQ